jgi:predicted DNA-binding protein (UPF0251 family)
MPRPRKRRFCGCRFRDRAFKPAGTPMSDLETISLALEELEALRLCDLEGMTQEEAGASMGVSRGTVQRILSRARTKCAQALVRGSALVFIEPGRQKDR